MDQKKWNSINAAQKREYRNIVKSRHTFPDGDVSPTSQAESPKTPVGRCDDSTEDSSLESLQTFMDDLLQRSQHQDSLSIQRVINMLYTYIDDFKYLVTTLEKEKALSLSPSAREFSRRKEYSSTNASFEEGESSFETDGCGTPGASSTNRVPTPPLESRRTLTPTTSKVSTPSKPHSASRISSKRAPPLSPSSTRALGLNASPHSGKCRDASPTSVLGHRPVHSLDKENNEGEKDPTRRSIGRSLEDQKDKEKKEKAMHVREAEKEKLSTKTKDDEPERKTGEGERMSRIVPNLTTPERVVPWYGRERLSEAELQEKIEMKLLHAKEIRERLEREKQAKLQQKHSKIIDANERREKMLEDQKTQIEQKMERAENKAKEHIEKVTSKARDEVCMHTCIYFVLFKLISQMYVGIST